MAMSDREYFHSRLLQELAMAARAVAVEAAIAHKGLARLQRQHCAACPVGKTVECIGCPMAGVCELELSKPEPTGSRPASDGHRRKRAAPNAAAGAAPATARPTYISGMIDTP